MFWLNWGLGFRCIIECKNDRVGVPHGHVLKIEEIF